MRLLVVEDDPDLNRQLVTALGDAGYAVDAAHDGEEGHFLGDTEPYDAVVLDLGLPKKDGLSVLEQWRRDDRKMPVLILTARERWSDKVAGMDAGADDYVAKPFHMEEVLARLRALLRRSAGHARNELECGPLVLDTKTARVVVEDPQHCGLEPLGAEAILGVGHQLIPLADQSNGRSGQCYRFWINLGRIKHCRA